MRPSTRATTFSPASSNSLDRMPPVQPRPTTTTSTSFSFVAMPSSRVVCACPCRNTGSRVSGTSASAHVLDAHRIDGEGLVLVLLDILPVHRDHAGETDHLPAGLVAVAAVDRVREHALNNGLIEGRPEHPHRQPVVERN